MGSQILQAELVSVAESADVGIALFDCQQSLRLVNGRFAELVGAERGELLKIRTWDELARAISDRFHDPAAFLDRWRERMNRADEAAWDELEITRPARRVIERFGRPIIHPAGEMVGRLEIYSGPSGQHLDPEKLQADKMAGLGRLVSGIAHELNNPLTSIMGYAQLLTGKPLAPPLAEETRRIYQEAERASQIVKNLLLFAREARPERHPVDLNDVIRRTLPLRSYELRVENIAVELELAAGLPPVLADETQIQQVILNLILNSQQAIEQSAHGGTIRVRTSSAAQNAVFLEVSDSGAGISPEILHRVFNAFFTTKPAGVATGLGLSIAYGIVRDHGGRISVDSPPGEGARFTIEFPAAELDQAEGRARTDETAGRCARVLPLQRERLLVVEDEPTVAQLIADVLAGEGHIVDTVLDSQQGLDRALKGEYDLVICDLKMPHLDGRAFYRELLRKDSPMQSRVIFVTGDTLAARTMDFLESSGVPYLAKPFLVEALKSVVAQALANPMHSGGNPSLRVLGRASQGRQ
jgi:two-component system NtrC family sensor kinase